MNTLISPAALRRSICLVGVTVALSACATTDTATMDTSADTAAMTASETKMAESDPNRQICKKTTVVGSKFNKRVCATQAEWDARAAADRETTEGIQRSKAPGVSN